MAIYTETEQAEIDAAIATLHRLSVPAVVWSPEDFEEYARDAAPDASDEEISEIVESAYRSAYGSYLTECKEGDWVSVEMLVADAIDA